MVKKQTIIAVKMLTRNSDFETLFKVHNFNQNTPSTNCLNRAVMVCKRGHKMHAKNYRAVKGQAYTRTEFVKR